MVRERLLGQPVGPVAVSEDVRVHRVRIRSAVPLVYHVVLKVEREFLSGHL